LLLLLQLRLLSVRVHGLLVRRPVLLHVVRLRIWLRGGRRVVRGGLCIMRWCRLILRHAGVRCEALPVLRRGRLRWQR